MVPYEMERELRSGEKILWRGRPAQGLRLQAADTIMIPFSLVWGGFSFMWEYLAITAATKHPEILPETIIFPFFGLPFVAIGIYIIIGRFFVDAKIRSNTEYAVTSERVIIATGLFARTIRALNIKSIPEISLAEKSDGSGTITFGPISGLRRGNRTITPEFTMIPGVRNVYEQISQIQQK